MRDAGDPDWLGNIMKMQRMAKTLPDDFLSVGAVQALADTLCDIALLIDDESRAVILGCGALLVKMGRDETIAGLVAGLEIQKAKRRL